MAPVGISSHPPVLEINPTNGLLRQYFPKGADMSLLTQADLDKAAHSLNGRPRQTLGGMSPSEKLAEVLQ